MKIQVNAKHQETDWYFRSSAILSQGNCCNVEFKTINESLSVIGNPQWKYGDEGVALECDEGSEKQSIVLNLFCNGERLVFCRSVMTGYCTSGMVSRCR